MMRLLSGLVVGLLLIGNARVAISAASGGPAPTKPRAAPTASDTNPDVVVLRVNGLEIDRATYAQGLKEYLRKNNTLSTDTAVGRAYRQALIDQLLVESFAERKRLDRLTEFLRRLATARRQLLFRFVLEHEIDSRIEVTTESVAAYYNEHTADFTEPERVQVRHILTRTREEAEQARTRVQQGSDFAAVAREVSIHPSKAQGGQLPLFARGTFQPEFEKAAFTLKVGELSPVIRTALGFHVIEKTAEKPARLRPLAEATLHIQKLLFEQERERRVLEFLETLRRDAKIETPGLESEP